MKIEIANINQLTNIFDIYIKCKEALQQEQIYQWNKNYPTIEILRKDINNGHLYYIKQGRLPIAAINISNIEEPEYSTVAWEDMTGKIQVIHRLAVHPDFQRKGIARNLMDFAEDYAKDNCATSIRLDAYTGNKRVLQFYENRGYIKRGEVHFKGRTLPFACMEKHL
jgi:ribosomal protein S18 acetylase RimI-like enzyme